MVLMRHPNLPADQVISAKDSQVQPYKLSGWVVVEDETPDVLRQLAAAGLTPEAVIAAVAADPPPPGPDDPPPTTEKTTTEAPAAAGASALPGTGKPPRGQRASTSKGEDA